MAAKSNYEIEFIVKGDGTVTARVEGLMKQFRSLDTVINKVNQDIVANQKTLKGTVAYYDQQIDKISRLRDATANTSQAYKEQTAAIDKLKSAKAQLTNSIKQVQMPMEGTLAAFRREIQVLRDEQQQVAKNQASWQAYETRIATVKTKIETLTGAQRMSVKPNQDMISNAGLAGATLTELGRTVSDANYGIRGMANNLSQLSTLFITLVAKTEGGFIPALRMLGKQLMGPLGIILGFQVVVQQLEAYAMRQDEAARSTANAGDEILAQGVILRGYIDRLKDVNTSEEERNRITKELINQVPTLKEEDFKYGKNLDGVTASVREYIKSQVARAESDQLIRDNTKDLILADKIAATNAIENDQDRAAARAKLVKEETNALEFLKFKIKELYESGVNIGGALTDPFQALAMLGPEQIDQIFSEMETTVVEKTKPIQDRLNELVASFLPDPDKTKEASDKTVTVYQDLVDELSILRANQFDAERLAAENELRDTKKNIEELLKEGKISQEEAIRSRLVAEEIYSEKWKQIREDESDFWLDLTKKDQEDATKERIEASKQQLTNLKQTANTEVLARKSALSISITDKKEYEAQSRAIEKESLLQLSKRIQFAILANKVVAADGIAALEEIQKQILALDVAGKGKEEGKDGFDPKKALDATKEIFNAGIEAAQAALDAELSIEEAKTAKLNNELRKRLDNENLSAEQKKQINDQIAKNEEALQKKRDQLAEKAFKLQKTASIANTLISTYEMATKAYKALAGIPIVGPALGTAAATAATVFGLKQVDAISRQQFVPSAIGGRGDSGATSAAAIQAPDFNVVGQSNVSQLASVVQGQLDRPVKTYVVASDVSTAQELERKKISTATI